MTNDKDTRPTTHDEIIAHYRAIEHVLVDNDDVCRAYESKGVSREQIRGIFRDALRGVEHTRVRARYDRARELRKEIATIGAAWAVDKLEDEDAMNMILTALATMTALKDREFEHSL